MMTDLLTLRRSRDALRKNLFLAASGAPDLLQPISLPKRSYPQSDIDDADNHVPRLPPQQQRPPQQSQLQQSQSQLQPSSQTQSEVGTSQPDPGSQPMLTIPPPRVATLNSGTSSKSAGTPNTRARRFVVKTSAVATAFANLCKEKVLHRIDC